MSLDAITAADVHGIADQTNDYDTAATNTTPPQARSPSAEQRRRHAMFARRHLPFMYADTI